MKITGNEPAYPTKHYNINGSMDKQHEGLTIRQQFAMAAMTGLINSTATSSENFATIQREYWAKQYPGYNEAQCVAAESVLLADALINELNKSEQ